MPTRLLVAGGHDITVLYANSNIAPAAEYEHRLAELRRYADAQGFALVEAPYRPEEWERTVAPIGESLRRYSPAFGDDFASSHEGDSPASVAELLDDERRCERCRLCYRQRLLRTAEKAKEGGYDFFSTTLSISPLKRADWLNETGAELSEEFGVPYLFSDFKKKGGYQRSVELSALYGLYRQDFCGCVYSRAERERRKG